MPEPKKAKKPAKKVAKKPVAKKPAKKVKEKPVETTEVKVETKVEAKEPEKKLVAELPAGAPDGEYEPEANNTGAPKNFVIRCGRCRWARLSSGLKADLVGINEVKSNCASCGKARKFQCPKCGQHAMMKRIRGNS